MEESATTLTAGTILTSREQVADLPVGSVICCDARFGEEQKINQNQWRCVGTGAVRAQSSISPAPQSEFTYRLVRLGAPGEFEAPATPTVPAMGVSLSSHDQMRALPSGSIITSRAGRTSYVRDETGFRGESNGRHRTVDSMRTDDFYRVTFVPGVAAEVDTTEQSPTVAETVGGMETLEQYKQRFRTVVYGSQQGAGVSRTPIDRAMAKMGVGEPRLSPGMVVCMSDSDLIQSLPLSTVLVVGEDPSDWAKYGVYVRTTAGYVERWIGGFDSDGHAQMRVIQMPGVEAEEWTQATGSESEREAIKQFKKEAWELGKRAKNDQGWCGEYEAAMSRVGIDETSLFIAEKGLSAEEVAALPQGTILRYLTSNTESVLYRRDDEANNPAKTKRIGGSLGGSWSPDHNVVMWTPDTPMNVSIACVQEMDGMPVGTVIGQASQRWERRSEAMAGDSRRVWFSQGDTSYGYRSSQFSPTGMSYVVLP